MDVLKAVLRKTQLFFLQLRFCLILISFFAFLSCPLFSQTMIDPPVYTERRFATFKDPIEELSLGGYMMIDGRLFLGDVPFKDTFLISRARFFMIGRLYDTFRFLFMPSWERQKEVDLHYAWIETTNPSWAQVRIGLFKEPFSSEALRATLYLNFIERSIPIRNYCQIWDIGIMVYGHVPSTHLVYAVGIFNGNGKELDNNSNKELVGRLSYHDLRIPNFGRFFFRVSAATGRRDEDLHEMEFTTEAATPFWKWKKDVRVHDTRIRLGTDFEWLGGPLGFYGEYIYTNWGNVHKGEHKKQPFHGHGAFVDLTYLLTGENKTHDSPIIPKHNFDPCKGGIGAWELALRYEVFYASKKMITSHFAKGANYLHGPIFGVNWYLNPLVVAKLHGQYIWFNRSFRIESEKIDQEIYILGRIQAVF